MGLTCKPIGKEKSIMTKLQNRLEKEERLRELAKRAKKRDKNIEK